MVRLEGVLGVEVLFCVFRIMITFFFFFFGGGGGGGGWG